LTAFAAKVSTSQSCFSSILCVRRNARPAFSTDNTPAYTLATPVWGGRLDFKLFIPVGGARTQIDALVTGALGPIGFSAQNSISDALRSFGDPAPQLSLKWNEGVNNFMVYSRGGIPVGDYNPDRIVNLGDGHASWDNGFGYTYFNATTGFEFSAVSGLTYNFTNPHTDYQNGIDWHVDLEASRFLTKQFYVGAVGYTFNQLTGDTGSGATDGPLNIAHFCYRSRDRGSVASRGNAGFLEPSGAIGNLPLKTGRPAGILGWLFQLHRRRKPRRSPNK
jgi:hypothetical protein